MAGSVIRVGSGASSTDVHVADNGRWWLPDGLAVDADGAPTARDIDPDGQIKTSLRARDGSSVNALDVPYIAIGGGAGKGGAGDVIGARMGDLAWVVDVSKQTESGAIWADSSGSRGPKMHEGSIALHQALGWPGDPRGRGGTPRAGQIVILLFVGTAAGWPRDVQTDARAAYDVWGGPQRLAEETGLSIPGAGAALAPAEPAGPVMTFTVEETTRPSWKAIAAGGAGLALVAGLAWAASR